MKRFLSLLLFLTATSVSAQAQSEPQAPPVDPEPVVAPFTRFITASPVEGEEPTWFNQLVDIDIKNATIADAVKKLMERAKIDIDKVETSFPITENKISLSMKNVNVRDALAAISRLGGAQAYVQTESDNGKKKTTIQLRKRTNDPFITSSGTTITMPRSTPLPPMPNFPQSVYLNTDLATRYKVLPDKKITIDLSNTDAATILKSISEQGEINCVLDDDLKPEAKLSFKMTNANLGSALDVVGNAIGAGWRAEKKDGKVTVTFSKKIFGNNMVWTMPAPSFNLTGSAPLPKKSVSLDKSKTDPREMLKEILKQADLGYAIDDNLPSEPKSFTFENVPISTALSMICESIGAEWSAERGTDGKVFVRIGKNVRRTRSGSLYQNLTGTQARRAG